MKTRKQMKVLAGVLVGAALVPLDRLFAVVGLVAGQRYIKDGLVAAVGVHFWADVVWHVVWPLFVA